MLFFLAVVVLLVVVAVVVVVVVDFVVVVIGTGPGGGDVKIGGSLLCPLFFTNWFHELRDDKILTRINNLLFTIIY